MSEVTQLLARAAQGETAATNQLMPMIYERLCTIAHRQLVHAPQRHTLSTTDLVHEAYLALFGDAELAWGDRGHFFWPAFREFAPEPCSLAISRDPIGNCAKDRLY